MYKKAKFTQTSIRTNEGTEGETIENKIERIVNNQEPITDGAPLTFTERKDGVKPETNIRTDRFEVAIEAMDKVTKGAIAQRNQRIEERNAKTESKDIVSEDNPKKTGE